MTLVGKIDALTAGLRRTIEPDRVVSSGPRYERTLELWNGAARARPAVVVACRSSRDVQVAVGAARAHGVALSVRGGGHDAAGRSIVDGGLTIDLSDMRSVTVDADSRTATVAGGATAADVVGAAEPYGLSAVTGTAGSVGMVGLTLGGGYGPLAGRFGLAADNMIGAEVVLASGDIVDAGLYTNPELLWALRGGGGNFGVVTEIRVQLHELGPLVTGPIVYPLADAGSVLRRLGDLLAEDRDELTVNAVVGTGPDGSPALLLTPTWSGDLQGPEADDALADLDRLGSPVLRRIGPVTHAEALATFDRTFPGGAPAAVRTRNMPGLTAPVVAALEAAGGRLPTPLSVLLLSHFHGVASRIGSDAAAIARREPHFMTQIIGSWNGADEPTVVEWADATSELLCPYALPGGYAVHLRAVDHDQVAQAYGGNAGRLRAIKAVLDPDDVFTAHPLPPAAA